jgi:hypothetical protein
VAGIALIFFLYPAVVGAQIPSVSLFVGYSYARADVFIPFSRGQNIPPKPTNLNGWEVSFQGRILPFLGLVADISNAYVVHRFRYLPRSRPSPVHAAERPDEGQKW